MSAEVVAVATERNLLAGDVVRTFGEIQLRVTGSSMLPTLWPGDLVRIESRQFARLAPGEVVFYLREGRLYLHRLVAKREIGRDPLLITRGDAMPADDPPVPRSALLGVATAVRRHGQWVQLPSTRSLLGRMVASSGLMQRLLLRFHLWRERRAEASLAQGLPAKG
jgi:signal peptidase I